MTISSNPPALEMESAEFDRMLDDLRSDRRKAPARSGRFRIRLTTDELVVETVHVDSHGKSRIKVLRRMPLTTSKTTGNRPKYTEVRAVFEAAAARFRVNPRTVSAHRQKNAGAIAKYWAQAPAECTQITLRRKRMPRHRPGRQNHRRQTQLPASPSDLPQLRWHHPPGQLRRRHRHQVHPSHVALINTLINGIMNVFHE